MDFDAIVLGMGHAGVEAALAAARMGRRVAAVTQRLSRAGLMSCNPAIGGPGKSQLVAEIDALGGAMARAADASGIQFRRLNASKGPASLARRVLVDRLRYAVAIQAILSAQAGLTLFQGTAVGLARAGAAGFRVRLSDGRTLAAPAVVVTAGTFLSARMHAGDRILPGGRAGDEPADELSGALRSLGLSLRRFKTGTPPRLFGRSIDLSACVEQPSEPGVGPLSWATPPGDFPRLPQRSCHVTGTVPATHARVAANLHRSPLFTGQLRAKGPRYCPSLEQKVSAFPDRARHAVYLEPEGIDTDLVYPAGLSTSLPPELQLEVLRTIPGLHAVEIARPGYAVEYDFVPAHQLGPGLSVKAAPGLFLAGQINGSSGYEEAAGQGLVAGVNAALWSRGAPPWVPDRMGSFLGVLVDDLLTRGFDEPYRVLPARAEARLRLREDNASLRLWRDGARLGLVCERRWRALEALEAEIRSLTLRLTPAERRALRHPEASPEALRALPAAGGVSAEAVGQAYLSLRYDPYEDQRLRAEARLATLAELPLRPDLRPEAILGLSAEAAEALRQGRPRTLGEAGRLPGMTPSALAVLAAFARRRERLSLAAGEGA